MRLKIIAALIISTLLLTGLQVYQETPVTFFEHRVVIDHQCLIVDVGNKFIACVFEKRN